MALPTRKKQTKKPTPLPKDFLRTVRDLFLQQFKTKMAGADFLIYGDLYRDEVIFCASMVHPKSLKSASLHVSLDLPADVGEQPEKVTEKLQLMVNLAASWFAQCFENGKGIDPVLDQLREMDSAWQPFLWEGENLHVKLNRDNYALERAASDFLKKAGFKDEGDDPLDDLDEDTEDDLN